MIDPGIIQEALDKEPFEPFRIRMADGRDYEIANPQLASVLDEGFFLLGLPDGWKLLSYEAMTCLESIDHD